MRRLSTWLAGGLVAALTLPGCTTRACTLIGGGDGLTVEIPSGLQAALHTLRATVCSGGDCEELAGPAQPRRTAEPTPGIQPTGEGETWVSWDVPASWENQYATLTFEGLDRGGRPVLRHEEEFRFEPNYPNGEDCDGEPFLNHSTSVYSSDLMP